MSVKKLFEETITISIEKYDDLLKKVGRLELIVEANTSREAAIKELKRLSRLAKEIEDGDPDFAKVFEEEVIDE